MCPACGNRRVTVVFEPPGNAVYRPRSATSRWRLWPCERPRYGTLVVSIRAPSAGLGTVAAHAKPLCPAAAGWGRIA
jgi:hypothetical protein